VGDGRIRIKIWSEGLKSCGNKREEIEWKNTVDDTWGGG